MFRLCVAQAPANLDTPLDRLAWLETELATVAAQGVDLVVLPELFACGYNIGADVTDRAEPVDGPGFEAMARLGRKFGVALHYGFAERDENALYNAVQCVSAEGTRLTHQRKLAIPPGFERQFFKPGSGCETFVYRGMRIATLICYDAEFPEAVRHVAAQGAELVLVPTALGAQWPWVARQMIPTRAYENGVFLAYANSAGEDHGLEMLGESVIAAPDGVELARAGRDACFLVAEIEPARVRAAQARLPYLIDRGTLIL
ncbi:carbon-nitrogen hydrolase family protein [Cognatishimia sp. F0-27]|uniref:carbon-nitrogen hydrolase family protein n=1 Tax=Cognatishimia sp. F0-27 TaxID=2816855 RepID=UPI001D0CD890|nr:carbon-nitrogen hydrolase family protein [Cognatishimia sp. F0-27]MCC1494020.1 carbon-nitrogen hydrolase family protein [Cognatishimia sp. F0-27]